VADKNPDAAAFVPARMVATLKDGAQMFEHVTAQLGAPAWPLSPQQHDAKARSCLAFAGLEGLHEALAQTITNLAEAPDALAAIRQTGVIA